ncbi:MAG: cation:proton antiporter [Patescibacteria group bacterium]|nr:cation:proton antiporter [Patescibacteria group bacterium]
MTNFMFVRNLLIVLLTAFLSGSVAKKMRLPLIVGYLFGGILIGNFLSHYISQSGAIDSIAQVGVILLLFTLGLEFSPEKLKDMGLTIVLGSLIQILLTIVASIMVFPLFGFNFYASLFLGAVFSLSSTAVALKTLSDKGEVETLHGEMASGWLFMQDLYTLPIIILLPSLGLAMNGGGVSVASFLVFFKSMLIAGGTFFLVLLLGKNIVPYLLEKAADFRSRELMLLAAISFCLVFAYFFQMMGLSYGIGAFLAGVLLSSSSAHHGIFSEVRPLRDLFATVFFVSLGFMLNPGFILSSFSLILALVVFVIVLKFVISVVLLFLLGYHTKTATLVGFSLISVGEFAFVLAIMGISAHLITQVTYMTILSVSFISLIISVPILYAGDKIYYVARSWFRTNMPLMYKALLKFDRMPLERVSALSNHVVVLGHGRVGKYICKALSLAQIPYIVVEYNHKLVKFLRKKGVNVIYGDPAEIDVLEFASVREAKVLILAYADRHTQEMVVVNAMALNPGIKIICRTHFDEDQKKLKELGVDSVVQPEFEAAISMTEKLLHILLVDDSEIETKLRHLRSYQGLD